MTSKVRASSGLAKRQSLTADIDRAIADLTVCVLVVSRETDIALPVTHIERLKDYLINHTERSRSDFELGASLLWEGDNDGKAKV